MVGQRIGKYQIISLLGEGGMGTVYEARNETLGRNVAIKVMRPEYAQLPELVVRFFNEAQACSQINHPGLVQVYDDGQLPNGSLYLVMELLKGETLEKRLRACQRITERRALGLLRQLASVLRAVHEKQIVHRDIKPGNIMLVPDPDMPNGERIKLLDFGIAKMRAEGSAKGVALTKTGMAIGTALYMAPEQCRGLADVDGKADIYSLGIVGWEMLAGHPPFQAEETLALLNMHVNDPLPDLRTQVPGVSAATASLLSKLLSKDRAARPSAAELQEELEQVLGSLGRSTTVEHVASAAGLARLARQRWAQLAFLLLMIGAVITVGTVLINRPKPSAASLDGGGHADGSVRPDLHMQDLATVTSVDLAEKIDAAQPLKKSVEPPKVEPPKPPSRDAKKSPLPSDKVPPTSTKIGRSVD